MEKAKVIDISKDMKKVKTILRKLPKDKKVIAESLYNELEFMQRTLETLKSEVDKTGPTAMFKQGRQEFLRESPSLKAYNTTIQRYSLIYKQIIDLLPKDDNKSKDELLDFIKEK